MAVLAVSAVAAASASAEPEWLVNEKPVTESTAVTFSKSGSVFEMADIKAFGGAIVLTCSGVTGKGTVAPKGAGTITEFKLSKCWRTRTGACKEQTKAEQESTEWVRMIHLSWPTKLVDKGLLAADRVETQGGEGFGPHMGFEFECTNIIGTKTKDTCETDIQLLGAYVTELFQEREAVLQQFRQLQGPTPRLKCSVGGAGSGEIYGDIVPKGPAGKTLSFKA
jgi:hypothetical protein